MRLAVVSVVSRSVEGHGERLIFLSHLVILGDLLLINSSRNGVLVENNVVGATLVVDPINRKYSYYFLIGKKAITNASKNVARIRSYHLTESPLQI